ncbi:MAG TPA: tetratricopeptide repeat protein [Coleofasciculaceae cyanobacterium]|jgi:tetratricopeptide (TPR) repeat protein
MNTKTWALALGVGILATGVLIPASDAASRVYKAATLYSRQYQSADSALQTGKFQAAENQYTQALKRNPGNPSVRAALGLAQAELYKLDAAEKNADQVLSKNPKSAMAHMVKGVVYRNRTASLDMTYRADRENLLQKSLSELKQAVRFAPNSPEAHNQLGATYRFMGRNQEAHAEFEKALDLDPRFAEAKLNLGIMQMASGNTAAAKEQFNQAIKLNSKNHMAHYRLGEALLQEDNTHGALQSLNTALSLDRGNASIMAKMGDAYERQGNTAAAIANYRKAIQANPAFMPAYMAVSDIFDGRGDGELAMGELRSALNVNPNWSPGRNKLGRIALTVDKPDQALIYFRESLKQNPNDSDAINGVAQSLTVIAQKQASWSETLGAESDLINAEHSIQEALRTNPNDLRLHLANLRISQLAGKPAMSEAELKTLTSITPKNEAEALIQGEAYLSLGRYEEADQVMGRLLQQSSGDADKLLIIGDTLKMNGDLMRAKDAYQMALAAEPSNLKAQRGIDRIAKAEAESGRTLRTAKALNNWRRTGKESSIDFYEDALSKNPRQPEARLTLSKLYEKTRQYDKAARSYQFYVSLRPDLTQKEKEGYTKRITHLQELATKEAQRPIAQKPQKPLPSTMTPLSSTPAVMPGTRTSQEATGVTTK